MMCTLRSLFVECIGGGGTLEWDVSANKLAHQWPNTTGGVYSSHDKNSQFVLVSDQTKSRAVVFQPNSECPWEPAAHHPNAP